jgi:hypothetical protein
MKLPTRHDTTPEGACDPEGLLTSYQRSLATLFDAFAATADTDERRQLAERICHVVSAQCDVDEEFLYPEAARLGERPDNRVRAAQLEGAFVRKVVAQIRSLPHEDHRFGGTVDILRDYLADYVAQQRADVLPKLRRQGARIAELCQTMFARRAEILAGSLAGSR